MARLGGDEFGILLRVIADPADAASVFAKIIHAFALPIPFDGTGLSVSVSVGGCVSGGWVLVDRALLALADQAMYRVKRSGGNAFQVEHAGNGQIALFSNPARLQSSVEIRGDRP